MNIISSTSIYFGTILPFLIILCSRVKVRWTKALSLKVTLVSAPKTPTLIIIDEAEICEARQLETVSSQVRDQNGRVEAGVVNWFPQNSQAERDALLDGNDSSFRICSTHGHVYRCLLHDFSSYIFTYIYMYNIWYVYRWYIYYILCIYIYTNIYYIHTFH